MKNKCCDHLGNEYSSMKAMCNAFKIDKRTYIRRINNGWSKKEALTRKTKRGSYKKYYDHVGNEYEYLKDMCERWGVSTTTYLARLNLNWSNEEALTGVRHSTKKYYDHLRNEFDSIKSMCDYYQVSVQTFLKRRKLGWTVENALLNVPNKDTSVYDHLGIKYPSIGEMCKAYHIKRSTFLERRKVGWKLKEALLTPTKQHNKYLTDCFGNRFLSTKEMCCSYGVNQKTFTRRLKDGWTIDEALLIEGSNLHTGNALFMYNNQKYFNWKCQVCNCRHILSAPEIRQHYLQHIKNGEINR